MKAVNRLRGTQDIRHKRSLPRAAFDQSKFLRLTHLHPDIGTPCPDQLPEHLGNFRRGNKIAILAENLITAVIMQNAFLHEVMNSHRAVIIDLIFECLQKVHVLRSP